MPSISVHHVHRGVIRCKQCEFIHPIACGRSSNRYSICPRSIHREDDSSLSEECFFQKEDEQNKEKIIYGKEMKITY